ncbi:MAG: nicotinamide riboside transporter PnuC [Chitinophagaceae bacterium]|nr:nicotinamide riboside transporter PnuC [Chitinophagaceae bacterium]MCW5904299.1 nicotinamide riboside transporter PnuC [Chitinophagaceae bacterium]
MNEILAQLFENIQQTTWYEYVAVIAGILSVWYSRKENILVYPVGLINTIIYIYISFKFHLPGEGTVNFYYTVMSIYGWWLWTKRDVNSHEITLHITYSNAKEWQQQFIFFGVMYAGYFFALTLAKKYFFEGAIPWADAFATATAFTAMWLMAKKKVESWWWWIATNIASIPLYFVKTLVLSSMQYIVFLILAVAGLITWMKKAKKNID